MTVRQTILTLAVAGLACAAPAAQAHVLANDSAVTGKSSVSTKNSLSAMTAAGILMHAAANFKNEQRLLGEYGVSVRPDDRAGARGV
jgi:hypothetical protein